MSTTFYCFWFNSIENRVTPKTDKVTLEITASVANALSTRPLIGRMMKLISLLTKDYECQKFFSQNRKIRLLDMRGLTKQCSSPNAGDIDLAAYVLQIE